MIAQFSPRLGAAIIAFAGVLLVSGVLTALLLVRAGRAVPGEDVARRILRNSVLPFAIQIVVRAIDLGFAMVLYRVLAGDKSAQGDYNLAALLVSLYLATISEWGLGVLLTREVARDRDAIRSTFGTALLLRLVLSLAALPVAALIIVGYHGLQSAGIFADAISGRGTLLIGILTLTLLPGAIGGAVTSVYLATERPVLPALVNLLTNVLSTLLRLAALVLGFGVVGVAWAALLATLCSALLFAALLRRDIGWPGWQWDGSMARMLLVAAFPLMLNALLVGVFFRFDSFIIYGYLGPATVNNYDAAYKIAPLALIVPPVVVNALFPRFARQALDDRAGLLRGYRLTLRVLLLGALPIVAMVSVYAPSVIGLIAGQAYVASSAGILAVLVWFVPLSYVNGITQYVLIALDRQGAITRAFALTAIFNLLGNAMLVRLWGLYAAAAMTVASELVLYLPLRRILQAELGDAPLWSLLWRPATAALISGMATWLMRAAPVISLISGLSLYAVVLVVLRAFNTEDRALVLRLLRRPGEVR